MQKIVALLAGIGMFALTGQAIADQALDDAIALCMELPDGSERDNCITNAKEGYSQ